MALFSEIRSSEKTALLCIRLGITVEPWFTNASDYEQFGLRTNFPNTKRLG